MKMMPRPAAVLMVAACLGSMTGCVGRMALPYSAEEEILQKHQVAGKPRISVDTFNGPIEVNVGAQGIVDCSVLKTTRGASQESADEDLENIQVEIVQKGDDITITARQTGPNPLGQRATHIKLEVPPGSGLKLKSSNGTVKAKGATGDTVVETSNGGIESRGSEGAQTLVTKNGAITVEGGRGRLELRSQNGGIKIRSSQVSIDAQTSNGRVQHDGSLAPGRHVFKTSNGTIRLELPDDAEFKVDASTSNGKISSDFKVAGKQASKRRLQGTVGSDPKVLLDLQTSNGSIEIHKGAME